MNIFEFFRNNKKYAILTTTAILLVAVVVVLLVVFLNRKEPIKPEPTDTEQTVADTETKEVVVDKTPVGEGVEDPENQENLNGDGNVVEYEDIQTIYGKTNGIDVSKWQGIIDWKAVKESDITFAFIRIGYRGENGIIYKDEFAEYNLQQAHKNGILTGVYFFSTAVNTEEAKEEAEWTVEFIKGYNISYPVVYDCEGYKNPNSRMFGVNAKQRTDNALEFLSVVAKKGYDTMLYGAKNELVLSHYWEIDRIQKEHMVWVAQYPDVTYPEIEFPEYEYRIDAWQFTNKGIVNGIEGNTDLVVCYFEKELKEPLDKSVIVQEAEKPKVDNSDSYTVVNEKVTAKEMTNLRESPTTKSNVVATIKKGEFVTRVGVGNKGWSKIDYNGKIVYAISSYLSTEVTTEQTENTEEINGIKFEKTEDRVTAKIKVNLRSIPSTVSGEVVATLQSGDFLDRVGVSSQGWSKLVYNDQYVYAVTSYLSNEVIVQSTEPEIDERDVFSPVDEMVTAKIETNLRTAPSTNNSDVVCVLKNGEYVKRIGINKTTGWSKLEYNGNIVYAVSNYLSVQE